jgi:LPS O-antigen subunit length determinant protein (WzzB/FepE family)
VNGALNPTLRVYIGRGVSVKQQERTQKASAAPRNDDDEIRFIDIWRILLRQKKWVIGLALITGLLAVGFVLLAKPKWEASAVVQVGQVGQTGVGLAATAIESAQRALQRMKQESFEDDVLQRLKISLEVDDPFAKLYRSSIKVKLLPNTDLIELKVRGYSREDAAKYAEATLARLREAHQRIAQPSVERLKFVLSDVTNQLREAEKESTALAANSALKRQVGPGNRFAENVLFANILVLKGAEIRDFQQRKRVLEEQLSPVRTYPTSFIDAVHVPVEPAFPKKVVTVVAAIVMGLFLGGIAALMADSRKR